MAATITQIRDALVDLVDNIDGISAATVNPTSQPLPAAIVLPPNEGSYWGTMSDAGFYGEMDFRVQVYVAANLLADAADALTAYVDPTGSASVLQAIHADQTLGGLLTHANGEGAAVMGWRFLSYEEAQIGLGHWGVEFTVRVKAKKG